MGPYLTQASLGQQVPVESRKVDKTGLFSWHANKYSAPMAYQGTRVRVRTEDGTLILTDLEDGWGIARHRRSQGKDPVIHNNDYCRDKAVGRDTHRRSPMSISIEQVASQYRGVLCNHIVQGRIALNRRKAGFPVDKHLAKFDHRHQTTITKRQVNQLLDFSFIDERANLIFIGPLVVGKTRLASASAKRQLTPATRCNSPPSWRWCRTKVRELVKLGTNLRLAFSIGLSCKRPYRLAKTLATQLGMTNK